MIEIKLNVTPEQLVDIAAVMSGSYQRPVTARVAEDLASDAPTVSSAAKDVEKAFDKPGASSTAVDDQSAPEPEQPADPKSETVTQTAPDTTPNTDPAPAGAVDLDTDGLPWDMRIHASTKTKNADGRWKARRKPGDMAPDAWTQYVKETQEELKQTMSAQPPAEAPAAGAFAAPADVPPPPAAEAPAEVPAPPAAEAPADVPPPPAAGAEIKTFPQLLPVVSSAKANGKITDEQIASACATVGLTKFGELAARPDLIPQFAAALGV